MPLDPELLELIACPACHGELTLKEDPEGLYCPACALLYPVEEGIPILLQERAIPWEGKTRGKETSPHEGEQGR